MKRFFVKGNNFVTIDFDDSLFILRIIKGEILQIDKETGNYTINNKSITTKVGAPGYTINELKNHIAALVAILTEDQYIELRKFKLLKELPVIKKSNCNYIKKRLRKI